MFCCPSLSSIGSCFCIVLTAWPFLFGSSNLCGQEVREFAFTGTVTDNSGDLGLFGPLGGVQINDSFSGHFSYVAGPNNADQNPADPTQGIYNLLSFEIDQAVVTIVPAGILVIHEPGVATLPPLPPDLGTDGIHIIGTYTLGQDTRPVRLALDAPYQTVFSDDSLPTTLSFSEFTTTHNVRSVRFLALDPNGMSQIDMGQLTSLSLVPEPTPLALCLLGFGGFIPWLRNGRRGPRQRPCVI